MIHHARNATITLSDGVTTHTFDATDCALTFDPPRDVVKSAPLYFGTIVYSGTFSSGPRHATTQPCPNRRIRPRRDTVVRIRT